ncbi:MAG: nucleoside hydrolase [Bacteroidetes bacterium]|nr:MAG: nucleoside hydrolase [Bacteroidota bacterium]
MLCKLKWILLSAAILFCEISLSQKPIPIIFDTDIAPDYDDVGAMAILHAFADKGEVKILATISCNTFETTGPTLSVLNTYFNRPDIPIGITKGDFPNKSCSQQWAEAIVYKYPHALASNAQAHDALPLYRRLLSSAPDSSITIVTVGFFTNLAKLLESPPDSISPLNGMQLVSRKVKKLVSMAARVDKDSTGGYEFNVATDAKASKKVFANWPTPVIISGFEVGEKIHTGIRLIKDDRIANSPVKDAFQIALTKDRNSIGRNSWDETAVWVAVRGIDTLFSSRKLNFDIKDDGKNVIIPGSKFTYLELKESPEKIATVLEDLMMHQPKKIGQ